MNNQKMKSLTVELIEKYDLKELSKQLESIKEENTDVKIALLGEFSSGKTTLINSLIGNKILPTFNEPTTAIITEIIKGNENKCYVLAKDDNGEDIKKEISFGEIAEEVTEADLHKKLVLELKDAEFLNEGFKIVDTPGVSSIEDLHEDVTYGYLPLVDVAFMLMNIQSGTATKSLLEFLKKLPKEQLTKIYFVLNFIDTKPPSEIERLKQSFEDSITSAIDSPRVLLVSAKQALEGKLQNNGEVYNKSGLAQVERIIKDDILTYKKEIAEKKTAVKLRGVLMNIKDLLRFKIENLEWSSEEEDKAIKACKQEIKKIEGDIEKIDREFNQIKNQILDRTMEFVNDSVESISNKVMKAERADQELDLEPEIEQLVTGVKDIINSGVSRIKRIKIDSISSDIGTMISNSINKEVSKIKDIADMITDVTTFIATAIIMPGQSVALEAGEIAASTAIVGTGKIADTSRKITKTAGEVAKNSKLLSSLKFIGNMVKECNPLEKVKRYSLPLFINPKLRSTLKVKITNSLDCIFSELENAINEEIEQNHLITIKQKQEIIRNNIDSKKKRIDGNDKVRVEVEEDIRNIIKAM